MESEELNKKIEDLQKKLSTTEEKSKIISEKLTEIRNKRKDALEKSKKYLEETDSKKDPKVYSEIEEEIKRREEELESIEEDIKAFNSTHGKMKKLDLDKKQKELQEKATKLKKIQDVISKIDKNKDPKMYEEASEELERREEEYNKLEKEIKDVEKMYEKSNKSLNKIMGKYNIEKSKESKNEEKKESVNKSDEKKEAKKDNEAKKDSNVKKKDGEEKDVDKKEQKKESKLSESQQSELDRYSELISKGYDINSPEMIEFYKEIAKERRIRAEQEKGIRNENGDLKYPIVPVDDKTKNDEKYEIVPVPDKHEIVPAQDKHEIVPVADEDKEKTGSTEKLSIVYSGKDNKYIVRNYEKIVNSAFIEDKDELQEHIARMNKMLSQPIEGIKFKNKKQKLEYINKEFDEDSQKYIFGDKNLKKIVKKCDVQLLSILADLDMDMAKNYIKELTKDKNQEKEPLDYNMKYNLKGMRANKRKNDLSFFQRIKINRMAKKNHKQGVAEYIPDDKSRKWLIFPVIGALAAGTVGVIAHNQKDNDKQNQKAPEYTDTMIPESTEKTTEKTTETTITTEQNQTPVTPVTVDHDEEEKANQGLVLGSKVTMPAGVTYTEDSLENGQSGKIGELSYRPAGDYVLDRVALWYNGELKANLGTEGTDINEAVEKLANELGVDPSEIIQKAHISLGENHVGPTGWIKADEFSMDDVKANISKTYDQIQQEKAGQQAQAQKETQQQDHEDR